MKKLILVLLLALIPGLSFAGSHNVGVTMAKVQGGTYLFDWDAETDTANLSSGTVQATVNGDPTLSTDYAASPTQSLKATGSYDYYRFTANAYNPLGGVIRLKLYSNYTLVGSSARALTIYGNTSNSIEVYHTTTDRVVFAYKLTGTILYAISSNNTMLSGQWNDIALTYSQNGGATDWSLAINGSAAGSGSMAGVWDSGVTPARIDVGATTGTVPVNPLYIDDVRVE